MIGDDHSVDSTILNVFQQIQYRFMSVNAGDYAQFQIIFFNKTFDSLGAFHNQLVATAGIKPSDH